MYTYLKEKLGARIANLIMIGWYMVLLFLIFWLTKHEAGRFRYLEW